MPKLKPLIDATVFISLFMLAVHYFTLNPNVFDILIIVAMAYVMVSNRDINTVSLISIIATAKLLESVIFYYYTEVNPYFFYTFFAVANYMMVKVVHVRFLILFRYGPSFIRHNKKLTFTHQDAMMGWVFSASAALPACMLVEHSIRHLDWFNFKPMFFYTLYQPAQLLLAVITILVLYLMTYPKSAEARDKNDKDDFDV